MSCQARAMRGMLGGTAAWLETKRVSRGWGVSSYYLDWTECHCHVSRADRREFAYVLAPIGPGLGTEQAETGDVEWLKEGVMYVCP